MRFNVQKVRDVAHFLNNVLLQDIVHTAFEEQLNPNRRGSAAFRLKGAFSTALARSWESKYSANPVTLFADVGLRSSVVSIVHYTMRR